jgi:hypothetical protein
MMALIAAAMASASPQAALAGIGPYKSRGHGRGRAFDKQRQGNKACKYMPHQGKQECALRVARMEANNG